MFILAYWLTYPAYGELSGEGIIRTVARDPSMTAVSDAFAFVGALLAIPASLALIRVLRKATPNLALLGGSLNLLGWVAVSILLMTDVVATEIAQLGPTAETTVLFKHLLANPLVLALNVAATLHIAGAIVIGVALLRGKLIPRPLAIGAVVAGPIHLAANLSGLLWVDSITWVVLAIAYGYLTPRVLRDESPDAVADAAVSVDALDDRSAARPRGSRGIPSGGAPTTAAEPVGRRARRAE